MKSESEKFAGALHSYSMEAMMGDTKALQAGTSHNLGQNFANAFDIRFLDQNNQLQYAWTTSWGVSTRFIGAIIMTHGDDQGLIMPPKLAPIQVVIVPIYRNDLEKSKVLPFVEKVKSQLSQFRMKVDEREDLTPGFKFNDWELKGVPLRIEIGPKDVEKDVVTAARRDIPGRAGKTALSTEDLAGQVKSLFDDIHTSLYNRALEFREANIYDPADYEEFKEIMTRGWALSWWCGERECEASIKEDTRATTRNIPLHQPDGTGECIHCGKKADKKAYFARAY
jgi:prolyl-tRNA synthetase